ncbi:MAG TPA: hypothetical protein VF550_15480, partial [Polyangia bacterium]
HGEIHGPGKAAETDIAGEYPREKPGRRRPRREGPPIEEMCDRSENHREAARSEKPNGRLHVPIGRRHSEGLRIADHPYTQKPSDEAKISRDHEFRDHTSSGDQCLTFGHRRSAERLAVNLLAAISQSVCNAYWLASIVGHAGLHEAASKQRDADAVILMVLRDLVGATRVPSPVVWKFERRRILLGVKRNPAPCRTATKKGMRHEEIYQESAGRRG